jgi:nanoRNase/pAp phosphatase (c-di-AMP/oligoRNAs hydrolase)
MIRLLDVRMIHIDDLRRKRVTKTVLLDSQPNHHERFSDVSPEVIIDHHPDTGAKAPFVDIRPRYGATASMMTEYLRAARIKPSSKLATALFHAIKTDTSNFERQTLIEDLKAFQFLFRYANTHLARRIEQADLRFDFLRYFRIALEEMKLRGGRMFVYLGEVVNPDVCVLIADFFMRLTCVDWSVVSGIHAEKLIVIMRNDGIRKNAGKLASQSFGKIGSAGGHRSMSRAEIPLENLPEAADPNRGKQISRWIIDQVEKRTANPGAHRADPDMKKAIFGKGG